MNECSSKPKRTFTVRDVKHNEGCSEGDTVAVEVHKGVNTNMETLTDSEAVDLLCTLATYLTHSGRLTSFEFKIN